MRQLIAKDLRELLASRAFWLLLLVVGLLVGHAFLTAAATYAELSGAAGGTPVLAQGLNPLDGIVRPTFGAYTLAVTLLLPFVAIRLIANERQSGAMRLLLQAPVSRGQIIASKLVVLMIAWLVAMIPAAVALMQWRLAGGHLHGPEVMSVVIGHLAVAAITIGVALAAGAIAGSPASAAILALTFTLGVWAIDFAATVQGGWIASFARYTPSVVLRAFENAEIRASAMGISIVIALLGAALATIALDMGEQPLRKAVRAGTCVVLAALAAMGLSLVAASADLSEDRRTSFSEPHEAALRSIGRPLSLTVHLGAEDPRRLDLEREILAKLRRVMDVNVTYAGASATGLTSRDEHYGEMVYAIGDRADTTRSVIEPVVLELLYRLGGVTPPRESTEDSPYAGYPMASRPRGIALTFFGLWPVAVLAAWLLSRRKL